jgi:acyl carrier protein
MEKLTTIVEKLLVQLATSKGVPLDSPPYMIVEDSLDQMRILVALEEGLDTVFDDADFRTLNLESRTALINSILAIIPKE